MLAPRFVEVLTSEEILLNSIKTRNAIYGEANFGDKLRKDNFRGKKENFRKVNLRFCFNRFQWHSSPHMPNRIQDNINTFNI